MYHARPLSNPFRLSAAMAALLGVVATTTPARATELMTLDQATTIARATLEHARREGLRPMSVVVLDADGGIRLALREAGVGRGAFELTEGKAATAYDYRLPTRALGQAFAGDAVRAIGLATARQGHFVIIPGGRPIFDAQGHMIGAAAAGGDKPDNDDAAIVAGIAAAGLVGDAPREAAPPPWKPAGDR